MKLLEKSSIASIPVIGALVLVHYGAYIWQLGLRDGLMAGTTTALVLAALAGISSAAIALLTRKVENLLTYFPILLMGFITVGLVMYVFGTFIQTLTGIPFG